MDTRNSSETIFVQTNLFKMWGLKRPADSKAGGSSIVRSRSSDSRVLHKNRKLLRVGEGIASSGAAVKRNCPFYKRNADFHPEKMFCVTQWRLLRVDSENSQRPLSLLEHKALDRKMFTFPSLRH